jgi:CopG family transcriptional regulator/antitoxin EndoAI
MTLKKRTNITLPERTVQLLDRVVPKGDRSRLIDHAVRRYIETVGRRNLRRQLATGARLRAERDLALAADWFAIEEEAMAGERR